MISDRWTGIERLMLIASILNEAQFAFQAGNSQEASRLVESAKMLSTASRSFLEVNRDSIINSAGDYSGFSGNLTFEHGPTWAFPSACGVTVACARLKILDWYKSVEAILTEGEKESLIKLVDQMVAERTEQCAKIAEETMTSANEKLFFNSTFNNAEKEFLAGKVSASFYNAAQIRALNNQETES